MYARHELRPMYRFIGLTEDCTDNEFVCVQTD